MKVFRENGELVLVAGGLRGEDRLPLAHLQSWDLLYEGLGRRFLAFHTSGQTHYVNLPRLSAAARAELVAELTGLLGQGPSVELLAEERDNEHWLKVWEFIKTIGRYLRLFINPRLDPRKPRS